MATFGILDVGTTNTRLALTTAGGKLITQTRARIGVKDVATGGSKELLKAEITRMVNQGLADSGATVTDLVGIIGSGMVTSEVGLAELPHLSAPVSMDQLAAGMVSFEPGEILPIPVRTHFVRGIKALYDPAHMPLKLAGKLDFMRGEETQVAGLLRMGVVSGPFSAVVLSSHTKFIPVDGSARILGSVTTLSGQLYEAIVNGTLIGKSVTSQDPDPVSREKHGNAAGKTAASMIDADVVDLAYESIENGGFLRAIMLPRFMDTLMDTRLTQRRQFLEAAIAVEDMRVLRLYAERGFSLDTPFVLIGARDRCSIYAYALRKTLGKELTVITISDSGEIEMLAIRGALDLASRAGIV